MTESSSVGESHTYALADPDLTLPNHPTLIDQLRDANILPKQKLLNNSGEVDIWSGYRWFWPGDKFWTAADIDQP